MNRLPYARTVPALVEEQAERYALREAVVASGRRYTYAALRDEVRAVAKGLIALGVEKGDKVALLMGNSPDWVITDLAICMIGGIMVSVNTWLTARELEYVLENSDANVLVTCGTFLKYDYLAMLESMQPHAERLPQLRQIVVLDSAHRDDYRRYSELRQSGATISDADLNARQDDVGANDIAYLVYTSGSTTQPKAALLRHFGLIEVPWRIGEREHATCEDKLWFGGSLFWAFGCANTLFNALTHGACLLLQEHFAAGEAIKMIERERCTMFFGVAHMARLIYEHPSRQNHDLSSLRGGATTGKPEQILRVMELGVREVCNVFGMTESYGHSHVTDAGDSLEIRLRSCGRPLPGVERRIVDPATEKILPVGESGEIRLRGYVATGYYKDAAKTAASFDVDGFFKTGDLGSVDAAGNLYYLGRLKEMLKSGGININPLEVEDVLMTHPDVKLAYCIGMPDRERDEIPVAVVVPETGKELAAEELSAFCRKSLAAYKVPRHFRFATENTLPLTTTGKLKKDELLKTYFS